MRQPREAATGTDTSLDGEHVTDDPPRRDARVTTTQRERLRHELTIRAALGLLILLFDQFAGEPHQGVRLTALAALLVNVPYYLAGRTGRSLYAQAYVRICGDVALITFGIFAAGGLAAAAYIGVYALVPVYAGIAFSSSACITATVLGTVSFLAVAFAQQAGWLPMLAPRPTNAWTVAAFNLINVNVIGGFTAVLANAVRESRRRLAALNQELDLRSRRLATLVDVGQRLTRGLDLAAVLGSIASAAAQVFEGEAGFRLVEGDELVRIGATPGAQEAMARDRLRLGESLSGRVAETGQALIVSDIGADQRLIEEHRGVIRPERSGALLCVPIRLNDRILGTLQIYRERGYQFDAAALELATALADQAGIAIENARLYASTRAAYEELSQKDAQLVQAQKLEGIGRLAGGVAHDFNNLLTVILGRGHVLRRLAGTNTALQAEIALVDQAATQASELTRQLLAFSRKQVLEPKALDLNALVSGFAPMLERIIGEDVKLEAELQSALGSIRADASQLEQIIMNLAVNARDAMPEGGRLAIATANVELGEADTKRDVDVRTGPYVMLAVSDSGTGMDQETMSRIFDPFFTTKEPGKGTGLGLATVYGIVKQSQGHIWVDSTPGRGTTFRLYFPRVRERVHRTIIEDLPPLPSGGSETILLAEDEESVRIMLREMLRDAGYTVLEAGNGAEALEIAAREPGRIDLLLTDVVMPGTRGPELAARVLELHPEARVLYASGYTDSASMAHHVGLKLGTYLQKPFTIETLLGQVRAVLDAETSSA